jgi:beta-glucosidase
LGWEIYPDGLYYLLTEDIAPYRLDSGGNARDIFITENGMATMFAPELSDGNWSLDDEQRARYLATHLGAIHQAIVNGANVKGYLHWSLMDNFEWADGLTARFGLVRVAYPTQATALRDSAKLYARIARHNALDFERLLAAN